jgi:hypothetical protein
MSEKKQDWFIAERTRTLALLHLTRRKDLAIQQAGPGVGLDYLVGIRKQEGEPSLRQFGVYLRGAKNAVTEEHLNKVLRPTLSELLGFGEFPYPVCLFYFTMDDDQGYYTWVAEPTIQEKSPLLVLHSEPRCQKLDRAALDRIVAAVDHWYDIFFGRIAVKVS